MKQDIKKCLKSFPYFELKSVMWGLVINRIFVDVFVN